MTTVPDRLVYPFENRDRRVALCPDCDSGIACPPEMGWVHCFHCGGDFGVAADGIKWPVPTWRVWVTGEIVRASMLSPA